MILTSSLSQNWKNVSSARAKYRCKSFSSIRREIKYISLNLYRIHYLVNNTILNRSVLFILIKELFHLLLKLFKYWNKYMILVGLNYALFTSYLMYWEFHSGVMWAANFSANFILLNRCRVYYSFTSSFSVTPILILHRFRPIYFWLGSNYNE